MVVFLVSIFLIWGAIKVFPLYGLIDKPKKYGLSREPIPYSGGIVVFIIFILFTTLLLKINVQLVALLLAASMILMVSFMDDLFGLSPIFRLCVHFVAALLVLYFGIGIDLIRNPFGGLIELKKYLVSFELMENTYALPILAYLFTIIWIMGMINTMNWVDGINGMSSGIAAIGFLILFFLSVKPTIHTIDQSQVATMSIILSAVTFAFLLFEFYPAKILMGDSGTMFLGFMMAVLAIFSGGKVATAFLVMGVPILDAIWVFLRRILQGKNPMKGDLYHFYHRLLQAGFSDREALLVMYSFSFIFGGLALTFDNAASKGILILALVVLMVVFGVLVLRIVNRKKKADRDG